ncbi:MAG: hypothetical protein ACRDJ5_07270 [Actinomycetota bacterium]
MQGNVAWFDGSSGRQGEAGPEADDGEERVTEQIRFHFDPL